VEACLTAKKRGNPDEEGQAEQDIRRRDQTAQGDSREQQTGGR